MTKKLLYNVFKQLYYNMLKYDIEIYEYFEKKYMKII